MVENKQGLLLVISGPSGAGKGTICKQLLESVPGVSYSVSATTREPRNGEVEGKDYYFVSREKFPELIAQDQLLEHAEFCGNYYGTPRAAVEQAIKEGSDVLLEIEIQGALQVKKKFPQGVFIFIVPPSLEELNARISKRGTETEDKILQRIAKASEELRFISEYDYVVENDRLPDAVEKLKAIIVAEKCRVKRGSA